MKRSFLEIVKDRKILSWALYDFGNSAYATTVMAGFFPLFFKQYWSNNGSQLPGNIAAVQSTAMLGYANSFASLVLGLSAPLFGALADRAQGRKKFLLGFTFLGALGASSLALVGQGSWGWAVALYVVSSVGFWGSQNFYDSLLPFVARKSEMDHVSGLGYSLGYLGGGILFAMNVFMTLQPKLFGLASAAEAVRVSFFMVGLWWITFTVPLMMKIEEKKDDPQPIRIWPLIRDSFAQVAHTFRTLKNHKPAFIFLIAYFFYIDGVNTIIKMAVDYGMSIGFKSDSLIIALLMVQFIGFPAAIAFGFLAQKLGSKRTLFLAIAIYALVTVLATQLQVEWHFYALAGLIGLVQGGIQAISRSVFGRLIPGDHSGEFFGFFNMLGRFSSILGPILIAVTGLLSESSRLAMLSLLILFAIGAWLLSKVNFSEGEIA